MKQILKDAFKSNELESHLTDVIAVDDKMPVEQLSDHLIINEAHYVLEKFTGGLGFEQEEDYMGENGVEQQRWARKEVAALRKFVKKYKAKS
jgi:hypothetical protein